ncbi:hypothetical protein F511_16760 [Dorcoceras hygrometricum]|uniref:Uncharacterized protein n=1 Tax=Dorcoceras hygrometricum TaxID=472368 RepID=A0A2Z7CRH4_9LAMI|nr:hypothetical protein F511_16760 [Dorcoceras hygrometricum]
MLSNYAANSHSFNSLIYGSKLVPIESSKRCEPSATNLAPNDGVNRRQATEKAAGCFNLFHQLVFSVQYNCSLRLSATTDICSYSCCFTIPVHSN